MEVSPFDNLPPLSKEDALSILSTPINQLYLSSDYYKAVFHLLKYPGHETEKVLLELVKSESKEHPIVIARRKAVEGLARLKCIKAIPVIAQCLKSDDPYLVENAAWAIGELGCKDRKIHYEISSLLSNPKQNRRVLVQSLLKMEAISELDRIRALLEEKSLPVGVIGASIAAISRLCGQKKLYSELESHLSIVNQNDRQCAVQDVIDAGAIELIPSVLVTPVAPFFRMRTLDSLWPVGVLRVNDLHLFKALDQIILDDPRDIKLLHSYEQTPDIKFLIDELFGTDFSRCYLSLNTLIGMNPTELWPFIWNQWERLQKDYGALYFLTILFRTISGWSDYAISEINELSLSCLDDKWPHYMKFRPSAILTLMHFNPHRFFDNIELWLDPEKTPFWACRYASLISIQPYLGDASIKDTVKFIYKSCKDPNRFVSARASNILCNIR